MRGVGGSPGVRSDGTRLDHIPLFGVGAFRGSVQPSAAGPRPASDPHKRHVADPSGVWPVRVSQFGAPSGQRRGIVGILTEYLNGRVPFSGEIFVAKPSQYTRVVRRRMTAPPIVHGLVASRDATYRAPMYVGAAPQEPIAPQSSPISRIMGGR